MTLRVGVILSGCGYLDGTEITEAVSILIALDRRGARVVCMAPNLPQADVVNHQSKQPAGGPGRNVLEESARITRGAVRDIATVRDDELDALVVPGGFGVAKNLSTFAADGADCKVNADVERLLLSLHKAGKPIGLACIAPCLAAAVFGRAGLRPHVTIGCDPGIAGALESMGAKHHNVGPAEIHTDAANKLVTTPCYMNEVGPWTIFQGAEQMVEQVLRLAGDPAAGMRHHVGTIPPAQEVEVD
jgi:enhancing lycopene biosynthesis protein 2